MTDTMKKMSLTDEDLAQVSGGSEIGSCGNVCGVLDGFLALRADCRYDDSNIIGKLYNGDPLEFRSYASGDYIYVYAPNLGMTGYVNGNYTTF